MSKLIAVVLLVAGTAALVWGGFSYTRKKHELKVAGLSFNIKQEKRVNVPVWAGVAAIAAGGGLLLLQRKR